MVNTMGWLSNAPTGTYTVPGSPAAQAALGYLHANCGMCHNQLSKVYIQKVQMDLWLHAGELGSVEQTSTYLTAVDQAIQGDISHVVGADGGPGMRIAPGDPEGSAIYELMNKRDMTLVPDAGAADGGVAPTSQMPPVGTELVDPDGLAKVSAWIDELAQP
jgi:hypothetical protein